MDSYKIKIQNRILLLAGKVIYYTSRLPESTEYQIIRRQLVRSVTSVGANYRAACRAKSRPDFINKLHIVEEECDESIFWMTLIGSIHKSQSEAYSTILDELNQLMVIIVSSLKTLKGIK